MRWSDMWCDNEKAFFKTKERDTNKPNSGAQVNPKEVSEFKDTYPRHKRFYILCYKFDNKHISIEVTEYEFIQLCGNATQIENGPTGPYCFIEHRQFDNLKEQRERTKEALAELAIQGVEVEQQSETEVFKFEIKIVRKEEDIVIINLPDGACYEIRAKNAQAVSEAINSLVNFGK